MQPQDLATFPPNTLGNGAAVFLVAAWVVVLGLLVWSFWNLMKTPKQEKLPPPGSIP
jgi:thiosulfate reductase cytochrome b subunit